MLNQDYQILQEIGRGSFGVIYKIKNGESIQVLKEVNLRNLNFSQQSDAYKEVQIMSTLQHPNFVQYFNSSLTQNRLLIFMEYCDQDLQSYIIQNPNPSEKLIWQWLVQILQGLEYLHSQKIIHRDIKPSNILIKQNKIKIGDLGVSKANAILSQTRVGTPLYLAPELIRGRPYDNKIDIWAVGCVAYFMCECDPPFSGSNLISLGYNIVNRSPKPIKSQYSRKLQNFIFQLLNKVASNRPSAIEAIEIANEIHPSKPVKSVHSQLGFREDTYKEANNQSYQQIIHTRRIERIIQQQKDAQNRICAVDKFNKLIQLNRIVRHSSQH